MGSAFIDEISKANLELRQFCDVLQILRKSGRPYSEFLVYETVVTKILGTNPTGLVPISLREIEDTTALSEVTVLKCLKSLAKNGDLIVHNRRGSTTRIALPDISAQKGSRETPTATNEPDKNLDLETCEPDLYWKSYQIWKVSTPECDRKRLFSSGIVTQFMMEEFFRKEVWPRIKAPAR